MERLTRERNGVVWFKGEKGLFFETCEAYSQANGILNALRRLAAYEDTWLEPEEVKDLQLEVAALKAIEAMYDGLGNPDHLRELADAERDGRLVVLPCKVGTPVWVTSAFLNQYNPPKEGHVSRFVLHDDAIVYCEALVLMDLGVGNKEYGFSTDSFGKIVFLSRKEAEAALEARKSKGGEKYELHRARAGGDGGSGCGDRGGLFHDPGGDRRGPQQGQGRDP